MACASASAEIAVLPKYNFGKLAASERRVKPFTTKLELQPPPVDSTKLKKDSLAVKSDITKLKEKNKKDGINTAVKYTSEDSIVFDATSQTMKLFGDSKITYGETNLTAEQIDINWLNNNVEAKGVPDSTGKLVGVPIFKDKQDQYQTKRIVYNFKTKKGIISEVITKQGDGFIHGEKVKKNANNELFAEHSKYTTCNLAHPHFHIASSKIKMIPEKKVISGPFNLFINDIPTPLGFPFGFFPVPKTRSSGIIIPTYGEMQARGFYLQNGGFYWAVNDYVGMRFLGDIYTLGGGGGQQITEYRKRYSYNGNFNFKYNWIKTYNPPTVENERPNLDQHQFWVTWTHSTTSKKPDRLTININAGSSNFNQYATQTQSISQTLAASYQSSVSYTRTFRNKPFNLGVNLRQDQNIYGVKNFTLPDVNFGVNRLTPFQNLKGGKKTEALRKFNIAYNGNLQNKITNDSAVVGKKFLEGDSVLENGRWRKYRQYNFSNDADYLLSPGQLNNGIRHSVPISTTLKVLKYFSLNPSFSYDEIWYNRHLNYKVVERTETVNGKLYTRQLIDTDTISNFTRASQYKFSTNLTTRIYGTFFIRKGRVEALRHTLIPSVSYSYNPDFSENSAYYQKLTVNGEEQKLSRFNGFIMGGPSAGKVSSIGASLNNNFELKVREKNDSLDAKKKYKKISLLDNVSIGGNYNFEADSFNLSPIAIGARTKLFGIFDVAYSATVDAYDRINDTITSYTGVSSVISRKINQLQWDNGKGIGSIVASTLNFGFNLNSQKFKKTKKEDLDDRASGIKAMGAEEQLLEDIKRNPNNYLDFTIPWSLNISYNLNYSKLYNFGLAPDYYDHSITYSGDLSLSEKWKIQYSSGFNLTQKNITYTRFGITRDLHCWVMSLNWTPPIPGSIGTGGYNFQLNVKSSVMQDLKITKNRQWTDIPTTGF